MKEGKYVIVHLDDSPLARELVRDALQEEGFIVYSAQDAQDFEQRLMADDTVRAEVDMFVLDMEMPDLMGAQVGAVMQSVYEELANVPFVIYSGKDREWVENMSQEVSELSEEYNENHKGYISKGQGAEEALVKRVKEVLGAE